MKKQKINFLLDYQYALGLTIGLLYGAWAGYNALGVIVLIWFLVIVERVLLSH